MNSATAKGGDCHPAAANQRRRELLVSCMTLHSPGRSRELLPRKLFFSLNVPPISKLTQAPRLTGEVCIDCLTLSSGAADVVLLSVGRR